MALEEYTLMVGLVSAEGKSCTVVPRELWGPSPEVNSHSALEPSDLGHCSLKFHLQTMDRANGSSPVAVITTLGRVSSTESDLS